MRVTVLALGPSDVSAETRRCQTTPRRFWGFQLAEMVWPDGSPVERHRSRSKPNTKWDHLQNLFGGLFPNEQVEQGWLTFV